MLSEEIRIFFIFLCLYKTYIHLYKVYIPIKSIFIPFVIRENTFKPFRSFYFQIYHDYRKHVSVPCTGICAFADVHEHISISCTVTHAYTDVHTEDKIKTTGEGVTWLTGM